MKITSRQLRQIIKEELLRESSDRTDSFASEIDNIQMGKVEGYRIVPDAIALAAMKSDPAYGTADAWSRAMTKMRDNPARLMKAVTIALEEKYGLPHGRYGEDASQDSYFNKLMKDPEGMKILRGQ